MKNSTPCTPENTQEQEQTVDSAAVYLMPKYQKTFPISKKVSWSLKRFEYWTGQIIFQNDIFV